MSIETKAAVAATAAGIFVVGATFGIAVVVAKTQAPPPKAPIAASAPEATDPADLSAQIIAGSSMFATSCSGCHGTAGAGGGGAPNLQNEDMSDDQIYNTISSGKGPMPPFSGKYNAHQIDSIVAYVRSLK